MRVMGDKIRALQQKQNYFISFNNLFVTVKFYLTNTIRNCFLNVSLDLVEFFLSN